MDSNFSSQVNEIISYSREEALRLGNDFIGTEHLLLGLIRDGENLGMRVLKNFNVDLYELRKELELHIKDKSNKAIANINNIPLTKQAEKVIRIMVLEAKTLKSSTVESEHLMLSILKNKENICTQILSHWDVDYDLYRIELGVNSTNEPNEAKPRAEYGNDDDDDFEDKKDQNLGGATKSKSGGTTKSKTPVLDSFGRDITKIAESGNLDPIIGREKEIERVSQILSRRKKNNPILIGEPGVGKTAIIEGLHYALYNEK
jgi:ATP-dependent Clp protease ATP-binding subunit ClpC